MVLPKPSPSQLRRAAAAASTKTKTTTTTTKHPSLLVSALKQAANFTIRGATITFGSTLVSCYAACCIEQGSHRLLYKYFPHKYAQVEWANGLTQEQLDAVRAHPPLPVVQKQRQQEQEEQEVGDMLWEAAALELESTTGHEQRIDFKANTDSTRTPSSSSSLSASSTRFWNEQDKQQQQQQPETEARRFQLPSFSVSINEIQACAMTG